MMSMVDVEIGDSQIRSVDLYQYSGEVRRFFEYRPKCCQSTIRLLLPVGSGIPQDPITVAHEEGSRVTLCKVSSSKRVETRDTLWKGAQPIYDKIIKLLQRKGELESEIDANEKLRKAYGQITGALMRDEMRKNVSGESASKALDALDSFETKYEKKHLECTLAGQSALSEMSEVDNELLVNLRKMQSTTKTSIDMDMTLPAKTIWWNLLNFRWSCERQAVMQPFMDISLEFSSEAVGQTHKLVVSYIINCCTWHPSFEFRLYSKDPCKAQIKYCGNLQQTTDETWKDVKLSLHTGHTESTIQQPSLPALKAEFEADRDGVDGGNMVEESSSDMGFVMSLSTVSGKTDNESAYDLPGTYTLRSGTPSPNIEIFREIFPVKFVFYAAPEVSDSVFRAGLITNTSGKVLLPSSNVPVFWDDSLVAKSNIASVGPSEDMQLFFGIDQRLKLEVTSRREHRSGKGPYLFGRPGSYLFGRTIEEKTTQKMTLKSEWDEKILLLLCLRLPRSEEHDIKVQLSSPTKSAVKDVQVPHDLDLIKVPGWNEMQESKAKWYFNSHTHNCICVIELDPREHRSIEYSYTVEHSASKKLEVHHL